MISLIFFGTRETPIGIDEILIKCPSCEGHNLADLMVVSKYFHFFWIPFFPTDKDANVVCKTCGLKRYGMAFDSNLVSNYGELKRKYKHPWFAYTGLAIFIFIFIAIILATIFSN